MIRGLPHKQPSAALDDMTVQNGANYRAVLAGLSNQTCTSPEEVHPLWRGLIDDKPKGLRVAGNYDAMYELRTEDGTPANIGDTVKYSTCSSWTDTVMHATPPSKRRELGIVYTSYGRHRPDVYGLKWVAL